MLRFSEGYNEAMALPAGALPTALGVGVLVGLAALTSSRGALKSQRLAKSLIDLSFLFLVWKHAFVRADVAHLTIFFLTAPFLALLFGLAMERPAAIRPGSFGGPGNGFAIASAGLAILSAASLIASIPGAHYDVQRLTGLWKRNLDWIVSPRQRQQELARGLQDNKRLYDLPIVRDRVGRARIDFFGYEPGWLLLNDMVYWPRPLPISFAAANKLALQRNEDFYRDPRRAPRFVLAKLGSIDQRLVPLDDGLALGALLDDYHPALLGGDLLLLERNPASKTREHTERSPWIEQEIRFGETFSIETADPWVWLEAHVQPSLLGRVRALVLRPAAVWIVLDGQLSERPETRRFSTTMAEGGFLVSPLIETSFDLFEAYTSPQSFATDHRVQSVRFEVAPEDRRFFRERILVRIRRGDPPPQPPQPRAGATRDEVG
jgi:hypothetical protein